MPVVRFTATRSLIGGVSLNDTVTYDLPARYAGMVPERRVFASKHVSIARLRETYYEAGERAYSFNTKPLTSTQLDALKMFLDSCEAGEAFEFDPDHSAADGGSIVWSDAELDAAGYSETPDASRDDLTVLGFSIVILP